MKQKLFNYLTVILFVSLVLGSCKKDNGSDENPSADVEVSTHSDDATMVAEEIDAIATEANTLVEADPVLSGDASVLDQAICDASVVFDKESDPMTITITFNGTDCGIKRNRTGVVVLSMAKNSEWKNEGTSINVAFQNLKITRKVDDKSITLNGTQTFTNVSGGLVYQAASLGSIIHRITSNDLSIKFDDGTARIWNVARQKEFTYSNGLIINVTGLHTEGNDNNIAEWGTNRFGNPFVTLITSPVVVKQDCDFRITSGEIKHRTEVYSATATFGLDAAGIATSCPGSGKYYFKLGWTRISSGNTFSIILPYY